jgi:hypothetical protein
MVMKEQKGTMFLWAGQEKLFLFSLTSRRNEAVNIPSSPSLPGSVTNEKRSTREMRLTTIIGASLRIRHPPVTFPACECNWGAPLTLNLV